MPGGDYCTFQVSFSPDSPGFKVAALYISSNDPDTSGKGIGVYGYGESNLNVSINPQNSGTVTGTGINCPGDCSETYTSAATVDLFAYENTGYTFSTWTGCNITSGNQCTVIMDTNKNPTAQFSINQYTLNVTQSGTGNGTVTSTPSGINCINGGNDCSELFDYLTPVTLTAAPQPGSYFTGWSGDSDCIDGQVTMDTNKSCIATFETCVYSINPTSANHSSSSETGSVAITASDSACSWTSSSNDSWITVTSGNSGNGSGTMTYSLTANTSSARSGTVTIAGQSFTVNQANGCSYSINPTSANFNSSANTGTVNITASDSACSWTSSSNDSWITVTSGSSGNGNGTISYSITSNAGPLRTGTVTIAGETFTVNQANGCSYSINPTSANHTSASETGTVNITTSDSACSWTSLSNDSWITVTSGSSGNGNGTMGYSINANTAPARSGTITIAGNIFTVNQSSGCTYSIIPTSSNHSSASETGSVAITASDSACSWTSSSNDSWITVTSGISGNGNGTMGYSITSNTGPARTGTVTVAGETFTVNQANGCSYSINPTSANHTSASETGTVNITTSDSACSWTSLSNDSWITVTSGSSGNGNGTISYSISANTSPPRSGTLTIAGETFTINQEGLFTLTVTKTGAGIGSIISNPSGITCDTGNICSSSFTPNNKIILRIKPSAGNRVSAVRVDGVSIGRAHTVTFRELTSDHTVEVTFDQTQTSQKTKRASSLWQRMFRKFTGSKSGE
jgi:hypothetical protein